MINPTLIIFVLAMVLGFAGKWLVTYFGRKIRLNRAFERAQDYVLLELLVPKEVAKTSDEQLPQVKALISTMEQFLTSLTGFYQVGSKGWFGKQPTFSLEIIARNGEIRFFIGTPKEYQSSIEKQFLSYFTDAQITQSDTFKISEPGYALAGAQIKLAKKFIFPIQTYMEVEADPMQAITTSLSKVGTDTRAVVQILLQPSDGTWRGATDAAVRRLQDNKTVDAYSSSSPIIRTASNLAKVVVETQKVTPDQTKGPHILSPVQQAQQKLIQEKGAKPGFRTFINVMTVAPSRDEAQFELANILSAFSQYNLATSNGFRAKKIKLFKDFMTHLLLRATEGKGMILNTAEIVSIFHPPNYSIDTPGIVWLLARFGPAPTGVPSEGVVLGENIFRGEHKVVAIKEEDRMRHVYVIGQTGTGKSTLFKNMILQDIRAGRGVCYIDPHGSDVEEILSKIPKERLDDVVYFDPGNTDFPMGLNLLEWHRPEEKDFLINEFLQLFYKLFDPNRTGMIGPQFEHWARNAALTVMANPEGGTLIELPRLFTDDAWRAKMIGHLQDPIVLRFWNEQLAKTADFHKSEMYNYFISKFGRFMTNELMRNIIGQPKSAFDVREIMDNKKILLVNLSKGKLGDINAYMLGMILVAKINSATLGRQNIAETDRVPFFLYVDEFQNVATDTFATMLSEARKYRLSLNITHQYISQLPEEVRNAVFGNVGAVVSFRIGIDDAKFLASQFTPVFTDTDLMNIERFNAYVRYLVDNSPVRPFSIKTLRDSSQASEDIKRGVAELSSLKYGKPRSEIDQLIAARAMVESVGAQDAAMSPANSSQGD